MNIRKFKEKVFAYAEEMGFTDYELYYSKSDSTNINVYQLEVDKYAVNTSMGVCFRGIFNGKMGYAYSEKIDDMAVEVLVNSAADNSISIENESEEFIYDGNGMYDAVISFSEELAAVETNTKIKLALELEKNARAKSEKVINIGHCSIVSGEEEYGIINSKGIDISHKSNYIYGAVSPVITDGKRMYNGISFRFGRSIDSIDLNKITSEAVDEALSFIGATSIKSGSYKAALRNDVSATLLSVFAGTFSADNVQKGLSLLKGKLGKQIGSEKVCIVDNPLTEEGFKSSPFDAEGVPTYRKEVVSRGILKTFLYNLKTAAKDGVDSTGNASRGSYSTPVTIAPSNFYYEKGNLDFKDLLKLLDNGLLITNLAGTHSGANPVTGDFSLAAKGYLIKEGKIERPVEQITIAGNYFELLYTVEEVGSDLKFIMPSGAGYFGSPTVIVKEISVAGI